MVRLSGGCFCQQWAKNEIFGCSWFQKFNFGCSIKIRSLEIRLLAVFLWKMPSFAGVINPKPNKNYGKEDNKFEKQVILRVSSSKPIGLVRIALAITKLIKNWRKKLLGQKVQSGVISQKVQCWQVKFIWIFPTIKKNILSWNKLHILGPHNKPISLLSLAWKGRRFLTNIYIFFSVDFGKDWCFRTKHICYIL